MTYVKKTYLGKIFCVLTALVVAMGGSVPAGTTASVEGVVFDVSVEQPMRDARVHLGNPATGEVYSSARTSEDGTFRLSGLPQGNYEVGVESGTGLFVVQSSLPIRNEGTHEVQLVVNREANAARGPVAGGVKATFLNNPVTATLLVLGAATVAGVVWNEVDGDDSPVSPFNN